MSFLAAYSAEGELLLLSWETAQFDRPVELARLREVSGEQQTDGKQTITWFHAGPILPGVDDLVAPYIARSENIDREDYLEGSLEYYARGEALYDIPATFSIDALIGRESELGAEPGWTVEEFLDWLQEHPDAVTREGMTKDNVLDFCLKGTLEEYVQLDLGQCDFEGEPFRELLQRVQGLTTDSAAHWDDWGKMLEEKRPILEQGLVYSFSGCNAWENMSGEPLVYKGYPSGDGSPCYFYTGGGMGILSRSACKEGAYAFWEYYLLNGESGSTGLYYTNRELFVESMEHVRIDTLENQTIRNIVIEEASIYFAGSRIWRRPAG